MNHISRELLLSRLNINEIADRYQLKRHKYTFICPYHKDKHPSLAFNPKINYKTFKCFSCGQSGTIIDFLGKINGIDNPAEQYKFALQYTDLDNLNPCVDFKKQLQVVRAKMVVKPESESESEEEIAIQKLKLKIFKELNQYLTLNDEAREYLHQRCITDNTIELYEIKSLAKEKELLYCSSKEDLIKAGFYHPEKEENYRSSIPYHSVIFFHYQNIKTIGYVSNRSYDPNPFKKTLYLPDTPLMMFQGDKDMTKYTTVYLFEGILNGLSFFELTGKRNFYCIMGVAFNNFISELISRHKRFIVAFDPDSAGQEACDKFMHPEIFYPELAGYEVKAFDYQAYLDQYQLSFEGKFDLNDILCGVGMG
ncbi:MAG: toprim domain-containing protein [Candidatus Cloacimonetes bacterium]|nr:toprim domain-containing protein [Candidatus Cloacimonadota bacterium]